MSDLTMRLAVTFVFLAALLSASGLAALTSGRAISHFTDTPVRAHVALGPVRVLLLPDLDARPPTPLAQAARLRYGRIDGLARVRTHPLPGADGAMLSGVAIRWN